MPNKTSAKVLAIFFLVFGIMLAVFIFTQGLSLYQGSRGYTDDNVEPSISCVKFVYKVSQPVLENGEVSFFIENLDYSADITQITVEHGGERNELPLSLPLGTSQRVKLAMDAVTNFSVYPENCAIYKTSCFLADSRCTS
jgi:hypothetical protein